MSALTTQLEQLKKQQEELEKRIQEEAETKKKLNNDASIERLEALVEPITETLNYIRKGNCNNQQRKQYNMQYELALQNYNREIIQRPNSEHFTPRKNDVLEKEEIYITIIGILKKQDERIKELEAKLHKPQEHHQ